MPLARAECTEAPRTIRFLGAQCTGLAMAPVPKTDQNYFNERTLEISCPSIGPVSLPLKIIVRGRSREETIQLIQEGKDTPDHPILSMTRPGHEQIMHYLHSLKSSLDKSQEVIITDPVQLTDHTTVNQSRLPSLSPMSASHHPSQPIILTKDALLADLKAISMDGNTHARQAVDGIIRLQEQVTNAVDTMKNKAAQSYKVILPLQSNGQHWYTAVISVQNMNAEIHVINSINEMANIPFDQIRTDYETKLLRFVVNTLRREGLSTSDHFNLVQSLQYGNMGCGIAMVKNIDQELSGTFTEKHIFSERDQNGSSLLLLPKDKDRSLRLSIYEEALGRVWLLLNT
jgi:hypothetical protein